MARAITAANRIPRDFVINRQSDQARGLSLWWPIAAQGSRLVDYAGGYDGTIVSGGGWGALPDGRMAVAGPNSIVIQASPALQNYSSVTVAGWFYLRSVTSYHMLWEYGADGNATAGGFTCYTVDTSRIQSGMTGSAANGQTYSDGVTAKALWHIAITYDRTTSGNSQQLSINGVASANNASGAGPGGNFSTQTLNVLHRAGPSLTANADLADFRIYSRALSAPEVWALYDPATRYELCKQPSRVYGMPVSPPASSRQSDFNISIGGV